MSDNIGNQPNYNHLDTRSTCKSTIQPYSVKKSIEGGGTPLSNFVYNRSP